MGRTAEKVAAVAEELDAGFTGGDIGDDALFARVMRDADNRCAGLVYAIGTINLKKVTRFTEADFVHDFTLNALGAVRAVQEALAAMRDSARTASVVPFSSVATRQGFSFHASMGMAKGAVNGLALSLAAELAPEVRVNAIAPSLTNTPFATVGVREYGGPSLLVAAYCGVGVAAVSAMAKAGRKVLQPTKWLFRCFDTVP